MNPKYWLFAGLAGIFAGQAVACSSDFTTCEVSRTCPSAGAAGMGEAGAPSSVGGAAHDGGDGGGDNGDNGDNGGASNPGESAGASNPGESAGAGGQGGEGGTPDLAPELFGPCSTKGVVVCQDHASPERLACDGVKWLAGTTCAAGQLCDSTTGKCAATVEECAAATPGATVCREDTPLECGPDLITAIEGKTCAGRCKDGVCEASTCGDGKVEAGEECDDAAELASGACVKCKKAKCGDGFLHAEEQCDDGNQLAGDGCSATCQAEPVALALGASFTCVLSFTGVVKCWGANEHGQLGLGEIADRGDESDELPSALKSVNLGTGRTAKAIAASGSTACALLDNGEVKCWGNNSHGQLGTNDLINRGDTADHMGDKLDAIPLGVSAKAISVGQSEACAVLENGSLKCWGAGLSGQLGQENGDDAMRPPPNPIKLGRPVVAVSAGLEETTCALLDDHSTKCWGWLSELPLPADVDLDSTGAVGDYPGEISRLPALNFGAHSAAAIAAGPLSCAIFEDSSMKCWGEGSDGNAGQPTPGYFGDTPDALAALEPIQLGAQNKAQSMAIAIDHTCAVLVGGALKCWGYNGQGQLGLGSVDAKGRTPGDMGDNLPPVNFGGKLALHVGTGSSHTCAILDDGTLRCWGSNDHGELGLGDSRQRGDTGGKLSLADTLVALSF